MTTISPAESRTSIKRLTSLCKMIKKQATADDVQDAEMQSMYRGDIRDVEKLIVFLKKKNFNGLSKKVNAMDTAPRDEVLIRMAKSLQLKLGYE